MAEITVVEEIAAPADKVAAMVCDLTRMGEWSPENEGVRWLAGAPGPAVGARFRSRNRNGRRTWTTSGRVVAFEPGRSIAFRVKAGGLKVSEWRYLIEPTAGGCRVSETWIDQRGPIVKAMGKPVSGVGEREAHNRAGMEETLRRLKAAAEAG